MTDMSCDDDGEGLAAADLPSLADAFQDHFKVGVALGGRTYSGADSGAASVAASQYNRATPENSFKWSSIHPEPNEYNFEGAETFLGFAEANGMEVHGHTLVWHQQVPGWVFQAPGGDTREALLARLDQHMAALSERIGDRVAYWDVVNEAFNDDGTLRNTPWRNVIGEDYLAEVFALADQHFPNSKLIYNDFSMTRNGRRDGVVRMIQDFKSRGVRIDGVGMQGHFQLNGPDVRQIRAAIEAYAAEGVEVLITEMDVDVLPAAQENQGADLSVNAELSERLNPYAECLPTQIDRQVAERWGELFELFVEQRDNLSSVTLWGVSDGHSWLNNWPVRGRTNYALLFDRELRPKRALQRVIEVATDTE